MSSEVARFMNLENPECYMGHSFGETSAMFFANSGTNTRLLKLLDGWKSDKIPESYLEHSVNNRHKTG